MKKIAARKAGAKPVATRKIKRHPRPKPANKREACFDASNYLLEDHPELC
jgi:hypothetical protein